MVSVCVCVDVSFAWLVFACSIIPVSIVVHLISEHLKVYLKFHFYFISIIVKLVWFGDCGNIFVCLFEKVFQLLLRQFHNFPFSILYVDSTKRGLGE